MPVNFAGEYLCHTPQGYLICVKSYDMEPPALRRSAGFETAKLESNDKNDNY
jgi:hypothetical protein